MSGTSKVIFSGRLDFGNRDIFDKVVAMYEQRLEKHYRSDIVLRETEEYFNEDNRSFYIPRYVAEVSDRTWKNTINLLKFMAQFTIAGSVKVWVINKKKEVQEFTIEPENDKSAVKAFRKGREIISEKGDAEEAKKSLNYAIEKFSQHAFAYERRGRVNYLLGNLEDALYDYTKSINLFESHPNAYLGRAIIYFKNKEYNKAIADLELAIKHSIPHQEMFWISRRMKAECHYYLKEFEKAAFELKLFTMRKFPPDNYNYKWKKFAFTLYGKVLTELGKYSEAVSAFSSAMEISGKSENISEQLALRGLVRKKAGLKGFKKDLTEAAKLGSKMAADVLQK